MKTENQMELLQKQGNKERKDQTLRLQAYQNSFQFVAGNKKKKK